jgi:hypothetical protein
MWGRAGCAAGLKKKKMRVRDREGGGERREEREEREEKGKNRCR